MATRRRLLIYTRAWTSPYTIDFSCMMFQPYQHYFKIRNLFLIAAAVPILLQARFFLTDELPANIFAELAHVFGHSAMSFLIFALAITPLRRWCTFVFKLTSIKWGKRLVDWNFLIRLRRPIGIVAFFYMLLHIFTYLYLELGLFDPGADWTELIYEIKTRKFLLPGLVAACLMTILAVTSPTRIRRMLGKYWRVIHRLMYLLCILAVLHYYLFAKVTDNMPLIYAVLVCILLLHRILVGVIKPLYRTDDTGLESSRSK